MPKNMTNIAELLKDAPKGMKLYSPLFGEVKFKYINDSKFGVVVEDSEGCYRSFDKYGRYFTAYNNAECLLFPSKGQTWEGWKLPVEPNFKVGDWLVYKDGGTFCGGLKTVQVKTVEKDYYIFTQNTNGSHRFIDSECRLWTIADARDGDVLVTTKIRSLPFIYRKTSYKNNLAYYYAGIDGNGDFCEGCLKRTLSHFGLVSDVVPATKEQRDRLFDKMKEAGYTWDSEKKELKKIQPHYDIKNLKPKQWVLVRDCDEWEWALTRFSHLSNGSASLFVCINGASFQQCIPFEGNEHLLGTTDMPSEEYIN